MISWKISLFKVPVWGIHRFGRLFKGDPRWDQHHATCLGCVSWELCDIKRHSPWVYHAHIRIQICIQEATKIQLQCLNTFQLEEWISSCKLCAGGLVSFLCTHPHCPRELPVYNPAMQLWVTTMARQRKKGDANAEQQQPANGAGWWDPLNLLMNGLPSGNLT